MKKLVLIFGLLNIIYLSSDKAQANEVLQKITTAKSEQLNNYVKQLVLDQEIQGMSVSVLVNGELVHQQSFGYSGAQPNQKIDETTIFPIASITKLFVTTALHELLLEQRISIDTPIAHFFPELPTTWQHITIKQLLTHTSGLPEYYRKNPKPTSTRAAIEMVSHLPLEFKAGKRSKYNQTGFALIHLLIEKLSGTSLEEFIYTKYLNKFDMNNTFYTMKDKVNQVTKTYEKTWGGVKRFYYDYPPSVYGSAGLQASNQDLVKWAQAVINEKILPLDTWRKIWTPQRLNTGEKGRFTLGWQFHDNDDLLIIGHGGADTSELRHFIDKKTGDTVTVIWLSNTLGYFPHEAVNKIAGHFIKGVKSCSKFLFWEVNCRVS